MVLRRSIRIGRAPSCYGPLLAAPGGFFERTVSPQLYRWTRPCFSPTTLSMRTSILPPHALTERPRSGSQVMSSMTHSCSTPPFSIRAILAHPVRSFGARTPRKSGQKSPSPAASTGVAEWSFWNPSGNDRRDPNTLAPNWIEARTTPLRPSRISTSS